MMLSEIIRRTVELAKVVAAERDESEAQLPEVVNLALLPERGPSAAGDELKTFLRQQTVAVIYTLLSIMYLGRDRGNVKGFLEHYYRLRDQFDKPEYAIAQMLSKIHLVDYLDEGVKRLQKSKINIDTLETSS